LRMLFQWLPLEVPLFASAQDRPTGPRSLVPDKSFRKCISLHLTCISRSEKCESSIAEPAAPYNEVREKLWRAKAAFQWALGEE